jgi:hypothetical protein
VVVNNLPGSRFSAVDVRDAVRKSDLLSGKLSLSALDATFSDMEAARRKGYLRRDLTLLRVEADKILAGCRMARRLSEGTP